MSKVILKGKLVTLRPLSLKDAPRFCQWLGDGEVTNFLMRHGEPAPTLREEREWIKQANKNKEELDLAIDTVDGVLIGTVSLKKIDEINRNAEYGIFIGDKKYWGQGYGTEAGKLIINYGFSKLKLHRIYLGHLAFNVRGYKSYRKIGFKIEGRFVQHAFRHGLWHDDVRMRILREEWRKKNKN